MAADREGGNVGHGGGSGYTGLARLPARASEYLRALLPALYSRFGDGLISVVVFGSYARGDYRGDSDLDLLIVAEGLPASRLARQDVFDEVSSEVPRPPFEVSPILRTPEEASHITPLYLDMVEDAVVVYDRGGFFTGVLGRLTRRLNELGARRVRLGRMWYWVLKDEYAFGDVIDIE